MGEAMDPMSPNNMNPDDRHVCIGASFNNNDARLFLFDRDICLGNELLTGRRQDEPGECLSQGMWLLLGQEKDGASERITAVFDGGALRFDLVDRQKSDGDAA
jgi:hypothetical protein